MPGTNAGTGQPISFLCGVARREGGFFRGADFGHRKVVRTGRTRYVGHSSLRMLDTKYEYRCECGHVGWTRHHDILRYPKEEGWDKER